MSKQIRVAEMFAGVGGFRLGLDGYGKPGDEFYCEPAGNFKTVWANQWEPQGNDSKQFAWRCYEHHFGKGSCINLDINQVLNDYELGKVDIPDFDMLVGGFPCQDYSVAKPLSLAKGIEGQKGVLWWDIYRMLRLKQPKYLLLENVDRLLKSPVKQRGRDFAVILSCLYERGYSIEWRVINAAEYGMPQKRRRVYIYGELTSEEWNLSERLKNEGVFAKAFPVENEISYEQWMRISSDPYKVSNTFGIGKKKSPFQNSGCMQGGRFLTAKTVSSYKGNSVVLGDVLVPDAEVPGEFFIPEDKLEKWKYLKGSKNEPRITSAGFVYNYTEGSMAFPDKLDNPSRTILTGEGGTAASRMKHVVKGDSGRLRRLVPDELEQLQMFPKGWTKEEGDTKLMSNGHRAFCMGNALVVGIPHRIGKTIFERY